MVLGGLPMGLSRIGVSVIWLSLLRGLRQTPRKILCLGMRACNHRWATLRRHTLTGLAAALLTNMLLTPGKLMTDVLLARKLLML